MVRFFVCDCCIEFVHSYEAPILTRTRRYISNTLNSIQTRICWCWCQIKYRTRQETEMSVFHRFADSFVSYTLHEPWFVDLVPGLWISSLLKATSVDPVVCWFEAVWSSCGSLKNKNIIYKPKWLISINITQTCWQRYVKNQYVYSMTTNYGVLSLWIFKLKIKEYD